MSGQVDAVIGAFRNFELNQMDIEGVAGRCFYLEEEGIPSYDELIYVANPDRMDINKIRRFIGATELATQFIINNPQKSWEIFSGTAKELQNELNKRAWGTHCHALLYARPPLMQGAITVFRTFLSILVCYRGDAHK